MLKIDEDLQACWLQNRTVIHEPEEEGQLLDILDIEEHTVDFNLMLAWLTRIEILLVQNFSYTSSSIPSGWKELSPT